MIKFIDKGCKLQVNTNGHKDFYFSFEQRKHEVMNVETIIKQYDFNLVYAKELIQDLSEEQMTTTPANGLDNHPSWTLGHLALASADLSSDLGADFSIPENWITLFMRQGPGDPRKPVLNKNMYPPKQKLISELDIQHELVKRLLRGMDIQEFKKSLTWRFSNYMPSLGDVVAFMCINHESMHLGQLAAWRRSMGLSSALGSVEHIKKPYA